MTNAQNDGNYLNGKSLTKKRNERESTRNDDDDGHESTREKEE